MTHARDIAVAGGRTVRAYDTGDGAGDALTVVWHHGSPQTGAPLEPLVTAAARRGIRLVTYARPSYGGSTPAPGRDVAAAAGDVARVADALGIERFATMGASGGGPHALACAALLGDRDVAPGGHAASATAVQKSSKPSCGPVISRCVSSTQTVPRTGST